jgi:hypothetical protein
LVQVIDSEHVGGFAAAHGGKPPAYIQFFLFLTRLRLAAMALEAQPRENK